VITSLLERLCTACGHRIPTLCASIARNETYWRSESGTCDHHRAMRKRFLSAMNDLPFVPGPELAEQQVLARDLRADAAARPRKA